MVCGFEQPNDQVGTKMEGVMIHCRVVDVDAPVRPFVRHRAPEEAEGRPALRAFAQDSHTGVDQNTLGDPPYCGLKKASCLPRGQNPKQPINGHVYVAIPSRAF